MTPKRKDGGGLGLIVVVGWPGQWAATLDRDKANHLRIQAGQELTHFKLLPGASDADYNAYNYMVLTADSKPGDRKANPAASRVRAIPTSRWRLMGPCSMWR